MVHYIELHKWDLDSLFLLSLNYRITYCKSWYQNYHQSGLVLFNIQYTVQQNYWSYCLNGHNFMHSWLLIFLCVVLLSWQFTLNHLAVLYNLSLHIIIVNIFRGVSFTSHSHSVILFSTAEKWRRRGTFLKRGWPHGLMAKMYHSVASWIIEQQNCNFRDQCSMSTLLPFQREQLIINICCGFRLPSDSLLSLKVLSKHCRKWRQIIGQTSLMTPAMQNRMCRHVLCC